MLKAKHIDAYMGISSKAPVVHALSGLLATPNQGPGIYEREGWKAGDSSTRTITFRRDDPQGSGKMTFTLIWVGNDGTFSSASSITLPMHTDVPLTVTIHPTTTGVHSAILNLSTPESDGFVYQVLNVVVAAEQLNLGNSYTDTVSTSTSKADAHGVFFNVPA